MEKIIAKPVVRDKYWLLQKDNVKIGQLVLTPTDKIEVSINGKVVGEFTSVAAMKSSNLFEFRNIQTQVESNDKAVYGFPTDCIPFNGVWNTQHRLPLFTRAADSKSWYAAGYYQITVGDTTVVKLCPKLITLLRHKYHGPFHSTPVLNNFRRIFE